MMNRRMKILQLMPDYHENSHNYSDLAEQIGLSFPRERYEVTHAFIRGKPAPGHPKSGVENVVYFDMPGDVFRGLRLHLFRRLFQFCRGRNFDAIVCNRFKQVNMMLLLNKILKIPVCVGISHGFGEYDGFLRRQRARWLIDEAWHFVGVSPAVREYLLKVNCGFTERNTVTITNAIDIERAESEQYSREEARARLNLPQNARIIGTAGRLVRIKGHKYLIQAFAEVCGETGGGGPLRRIRSPRTDRADAHLCIIGEGREQEALHAEVARLGLQDRVHLPGFVAGAKRYVRAFDIWAMPSLTEGLSLALLEGMIGRLPVIASDIPALSFIIDASGGIAVPPADSGALAQALDHYLDLPLPELREKGEAVYAYLRANHGIEEYREKYLALVESALTGVK